MYKNVNEYGNRYCKGISTRLEFASISVVNGESVIDYYMFFQGFFGMFQGASNHEELHNLMKATVMIRRLKKDVLSQLPVKRRQQVTSWRVFINIRNME